MAVISLGPGALGIDCVTIPNFDDVRNLGYRFWNAYLGGDFAVTKADIERAWAAGIVVQLNRERSGFEYKGGYAGGRAAAIDGLQSAQSLGYMGESPIIYSATDTNVPLNEYDIADGFYHATIDVMTPFASGAYGDPNYLRHLSMQSWVPDNFVFWQWAGAGAVEQWTDAKQAYSSVPIIVGGAQVDIDTIIRPFKFWSGEESTHTMPGFVGYAMDNNHGLVKFVICDDGHTRWIKADGDGPAFYAQYPNGVGVPSCDVSGMESYNPNVPPPWYSPGGNGSAAPTHFNIALTGTANA